MQFFVGYTKIHTHIFNSLKGRRVQSKPIDINTFSNTSSAPGSFGVKLGQRMRSCHEAMGSIDIINHVINH